MALPSSPLARAYVVGGALVFVVALATGATTKIIAPPMT